METTTLSQILEDVGPIATSGGDVVISGIEYRSTHVEPGDAFFCIPGFQHDGHDFAADAVRRGAVAVVGTRPLDLGVPFAVVTNARRALALASAAFYGHPTASLEVVGITGTNGKTTTTYLVDSILRAAGRVTGLVGTVETRIADRGLPSGRTTPESADLQALFAQMRDAGVDSVAMEVSSHAIDLARVDGVSFAVAGFTNLTQDHLDYHHTLEEYWSVKRRLFTELAVEERVVNVDDEYGRSLSSDVDGTWTVGRSEDAVVRAVNERPGAVSTAFDLVTPGWSSTVTLPLAGAYNVSNALVAVGCALALGIEQDAIVRGLESAPQVPGRLERVDAGQPFAVFVDYAHTPDSLEKALDAVRAITPGRVIVAFGCGGDRDPEKRPLMGAAAARGADEIVITTDNPRSEDPVGIILQIEDGIRGTGASYSVEVDRRTGIARALSLAVEGDAVLIAGKGHETYQIFADGTIPWDDRAVVREELRALC